MNKTPIAACAALLAAGSALAQGDYPFCQILDRVSAPAWEAHGSYVLDADVSQTRDSFGILGVKGGGGIGYFRTDLGDLDLTGAYDVNILTGSGGIDLPSQLGALSLNGAFVSRNADGQALRVTAAPGIYSDLSEATAKSLYMPFSVSGIQAFSPEVSGVIGLAFFPGFDQFLDPRFGIRWSVNDALLIDLQYPESRITVMPADGWELYAGVSSSQTPEWRTEKKYGNIMFDEMRGFFGVSHPLTESLRMMYQAGTVFNREIQSEEGGEVDVEDAMFLSVGIGGAL